MPRDELVRRDYAATTIRSYIQIVEAFRQHTGARLDRITPAQLRRYHLFLLEERRLAIGTVVTQICALRFFCRYVPSSTLQVPPTSKDRKAAAVVKSRFLRSSVTRTALPERGNTPSKPAFPFAFPPLNPSRIADRGE